MPMTPELHKLCLNDRGEIKPMNECRAGLINHFILDDGMGVDEAEDLADKTLRESGFWVAPKMDWTDEDDATSDVSTPLSLT